MPEILDHDDDPTTASGRLKKKGMIGGRGRQGRTSARQGHVKTKLIRCPKSFDRARWKGGLSTLSPRALAQLAVVGGGADGTVFHVDPNFKQELILEEEIRLHEEEAQLQEEKILVETMKAAKVEEMNRLPMWKVLVTASPVRTCSGLHYVDASIIEGEIPPTSPRRPPGASPRTPRSGGMRINSPRHHNLLQKFVDSSV